MTIALAQPHAAERKAQISKHVRPTKYLNPLPPLQTESKRVLLIVPPGSSEEAYGRLSAAAGELPMLGLAYVAASLRDQGHVVKIIDYEVTDQPMSKASEGITSFKPDLIGMTAYITNMKRCAAVAKIAKQINKKITVVLGGPQVSVFPEEGFVSPDIDIIVLSEGEIIIRNVMNALGNEEKLSEVKGVWFRKHDGQIQKNQREILPDDLDIFLPPALDLYNLDDYYPPVHIRGKKVAHILTSRGCPFKCTFCETKLTFGRSFRYHSTERVLQDLETLISAGYDSFQIFDDIFTIRKDRVIDLCEGIIDRFINNGIKIQWMCFTRTNCVSDDVLSVMKKAGCYLIAFGGESGSDELLKVIKKDLTVEKNIHGINLAKKHDILAFSSFMLGLPTETRSQSMETIEFSLSSGLDYAVFAITEPYPGTELWEDAKQFGKFDTTGRYKNNLLSENSAVWIPEGRSREELSELATLAMRKFYLRPKSILLALKNFYLLPPRRALRYLWAGMSFFILNRFDSAKPGARY